MNRMPTIRRKLYPHVEPRQTGRIKVSDLHELYWEDAGPVNGIPVIALHGGPGGGANPDMRRFFDPRYFRVILFDQRGCGRSTPRSTLEENTTWDLISDIEKIREMPGIEKWIVFGGSWGSTLSLAYSITHPDRALALLLRGIFLLTKSEINWFYQHGASNLFPDAYDRYIAPIPEAERGDLLNAFHKRLMGPHGDERRDAARAWACWEGETLSIRGPSARPPQFDDDAFTDAFARIECHYFKNGGFFETDGWLLDNAKVLNGIPGTIVHGRYDVVTPLSSAWALHKEWTSSELKIIPDAGHSSLEPGIVNALIDATDEFVQRFR